MSVTGRVFRLWSPTALCIVLLAASFHGIHARLPPPKAEADLNKGDLINRQPTKQIEEPMTKEILFKAEHEVVTTLSPPPKEKPVILMPVTKHKGRLYQLTKKEGSEGYTKKECKEKGFWIKRAKGNCWRQVVPDSAKNATDYCPLPHSQRKAACLEKECEWRPEEKWRCYKTADLMERESVKEFTYKGKSRITTTFFPVEHHGISKEECEEKSQIWIPLPDWECWGMKAFAVGTPLIRYAPMSPEPESETTEPIKISPIPRLKKSAPSPSPVPPIKTITVTHVEKPTASPLMIARPETEIIEVPESVPCGYPRINKHRCLALSCVWRPTDSGNCWRPRPELRTVVEA